MADWRDAIGCLKNVGDDGLRAEELIRLQRDGDPADWPQVRAAEVAMRDFFHGNGGLDALREASDDLSRLLGDRGLPTFEEMRGILS